MRNKKNSIKIKKRKRDGKNVEGFLRLFDRNIVRKMKGRD